VVVEHQQLMAMLQQVVALVVVVLLEKANQVKTYIKILVDLVLLVRVMLEELQHQQL
jgi:hypothetical protein